MELRYFKPHEFRCHCGECGGGFDEMQSEFLQRLDEARERAGVAFVLTSAYRCPDWNAQVGGVDSSAHVGGWAVDIAATWGRRRWQVVTALQAVGFTRIGVAGNFIHVDCDPNKPPNVLWTY